VTWQIRLITQHCAQISIHPAIRFKAICLLVMALPWRRKRTSVILMWVLAQGLRSLAESPYFGNAADPEPYVLLRNPVWYFVPGVFLPAATITGKTSAASSAFRLMLSEPDSATISAFDVHNAMSKQCRKYLTSQP